MPQTVNLELPEVQFTTKKKTKSFLSRASSLLSFQSVKSHLSKSTNTEKRTRSSSQSSISVSVDQIKPHVLQAIEEYPHLFHEKDVERINKSDAFINRFIEEHQSKNKNNWNEILSYVLDTLKWRKEFGVNDLHGTMFPKEFYDLQVYTIGQIKETSNDRLTINNQVVSDYNKFMCYVMARRFRKIDGLQEKIIQFMIYCFESKCDEFGDDLKLTIFADISNFGLSNVDIKLYMSIIPIFLKHYPSIAVHAYIYELPWIIKPVAKLILSLLPSKFSSMVTFVSKSDYKKIIPLEKLPKSMGGYVEMIDFKPSDGCITLEELADEIGLTKDQLKKGRKLISEVMREIEREEARN